MLGRKHDSANALGSVRSTGLSQCISHRLLTWFASHYTLSIALQPKVLRTPFALESVQPPVVMGAWCLRYVFLRAKRSRRSWFSFLDHLATRCTVGSALEFRQLLQHPSVHLLGVGVGYSVIQAAMIGDTGADELELTQKAFFDMISHTISTNLGDACMLLFTVHNCLDSTFGPQRTSLQFSSILVPNDHGKTQQKMSAIFRTCLDVVKMAHSSFCCNRWTPKKVEHCKTRAFGRTTISAAGFRHPKKKKFRHPKKKKRKPAVP